VAGPPYTATFGDKLRYDAQVDKYTIPLTITRSPDADPTTPVTLHLASLEYYSFAGISGQVGTAEPAADGGWTITVPGAASDPQSRTLSVLLQPERETWPGPEWHGDLLCYPLRESIMATIRVLSADGLTAATLSFYDPGVGACEL
jgi:hypothetical protein